MSVPAGIGKVGLPGEPCLGSSFCDDGGVILTPAELMAGLSSPFPACTSAMARYNRVRENSRGGEWKFSPTMTVGFY